jgi:pimeloyl-ACP methyl ester carboxylesterase
LNDGTRPWIEPSEWGATTSAGGAATAAVDPSAAPSPQLFTYLMTSPTCNLNPYSAEYSVWLLFRLLQELDISNSILIGHSTGGALAVRAAAVQAAAASAYAAAYAFDEHKHFASPSSSPPSAVAPDRIRALCLVSPTIYSGGFPDFIRSMFRTSLGKEIVQQLVRSEIGEVTIRRYALPFAFASAFAH